MTMLYRSLNSLDLEVLSCTGGNTFGKHLHDGYVLWLNSEGGENYTVKGGSAILQPGTLSIIEPGIIHTNGPCLKEKRHLRSFYFGESFIGKLDHNLEQRKRSLLTMKTEVIADWNLWKRFIDLHDLLFRAHGSLAAGEALLTTFASLMRRMDSGGFPHKHFREGEKRIDLVVDYLHSNLHKNIPLEEMAGLAKCSSYHLIRLFRQKRGVSPHAFLVQLRLENARKMLASGSAIADAALISGFSDQSHLTRNFKARYGVTPGEYVNQSSVLSL